MRKLAIVLLLLATAACFPEGDCDRDQIPQGGICLAGVPGATGADAAPPVDGSPPVDGDPGAVSTFGAVCTTIDQCGADTDVCAVIPGNAEGFCSRSGCAQDATLCPTGWVCFDASAYVAGYSLCIAG